MEAIARKILRLQAEQDKAIREIAQLVGQLTSELAAIRKLDGWHPEHPLTRIRDRMAILADAARQRIKEREVELALT